MNDSETGMKVNLPQKSWKGLSVSHFFLNKEPILFLQLGKKYQFILWVPKIVYTF